MKLPDIRKLRDKVYGQKISDKEWEVCFVNWMKPEETAWLVEQAKKMESE